MNNEDEKNIAVWRPFPKINILNKCIYASIFVFILFAVENNTHAHTMCVNRLVDGETPPPPLQVSPIK